MTPDGQGHWVKLSFFLIRDEQCRAISCIGCLKDITQEVEERENPLVRLADQQLYAAKKQGKDQYCIAEE